MFLWDALTGQILQTHLYLVEACIPKLKEICIGHGSQVSCLLNAYIFFCFKQFRTISIFLKWSQTGTRVYIRIVMMPEFLTLTLYTFWYPVQKGGKKGICVQKMQIFLLLIFFKVNKLAQSAGTEKKNHWILSGFCCKPNFRQDSKDWTFLLYCFQHVVLKKHWYSTLMLTPLPDIQQVSKF